MPLSVLPILRDSPPPQRQQWVPNPYLHVGPDRLYNPQTDRFLLDTDPGFATVRGLQEGTIERPFERTPEIAALLEQGWLTDDVEALSKLYRLKFVSLEAHSVCNQACYFCPVSLDPRERVFMPMEIYQRIVREVAELGEPIEAVFMISYNEPTADPRFIEQVRCLKEAGLPPATLTNGTGLTPQRVDQLVEMGGLRFLSINISTLDRERYQRDRGHDHLRNVMRNLDYAKDRAVAQDMDIVVLGTGNDDHQQDFESIQRYFEGSRFNPKYFVVNDRAGYLQIGMTAFGHEKQLCGCDYMGSRPIQHLHITPRAKVILCCQDYSETFEVGDLNTHSVREVLIGRAMRQARQQVYGIEETPANFFCKNCRYALKR
jgi:hypothetical protein